MKQKNKKDSSMQYTAKIYKDGDFYSVMFPDIPGANTFANTIEEARSMAKDALDGVLFSMLERKDPLPVARTKVDSNKGLESIHVDDRLAIAYTIFEARRGKSAASIARKMGITRQAYQRLENPKASLTITTLIKAAEALGKKLSIAFV
ncbi:MAG: type II toxin-antitoxin system HicB family antitoxin [Fibrobacter sp.]|uniref:type II toxin-antitoxin system HicB family antitoxin n=1 Tax=Fibrobacter sp. TaxID=35828 RepID=UPI0025BA8949|nr:type II toxin-antitoxin system HicB family antitoxin [Fibrobacter sp.]MBQ7079513.1 type II toxin-antitoxin system HicB family antitoxin [Fibrobacter sp.]